MKVLLDSEYIELSIDKFKWNLNLTRQNTLVGSSLGSNSNWARQSRVWTEPQPPVDSMLHCTTSQLSLDFSLFHSCPDCHQTPLKILRFISVLYHFIFYDSFGNWLRLIILIWRESKRRVLLPALNFTKNSILRLCSFHVKCDIFWKIFFRK